MQTKTLYHATDDSNADSITTNGLEASTHRELVWLTTTLDDANQVADIYDTIDTPAIFRVEVPACNVREDPDPHGDLNSRVYEGSIPAGNVERVN